MDDLSAPRILNGLVGTRFRHVEVHDELPSTQTVLASEGGRDGRVLIANHQTRGRGRAGRSWMDVPGAMLLFSALLRGLTGEHVPRVGLAAGVAVSRAIEAIAGVEAALKWPNDVRIGGHKACGILGELAPSGDYVVVGIGVNVGHDAGELPDDLEATSLRVSCGFAPRRDDVCVAILKELDGLAGATGWMDTYRERCETIGSRVRVELTEGAFEGTAERVNDDGALVVDGKVVVAGDVVHVR